MTQLPLPGWYADPAEPECTRYWDGAGWADDGAAERASQAARPGGAGAYGDPATRDGAGGAVPPGSTIQSEGSTVPAAPEQLARHPGQDLLRPPDPARPYGQSPGHQSYGQPTGQQPSRAPAARPAGAIRLGEREALLARWWQRALAWVLDALLIFVVAVAITVPFFSTYVHEVSSYFRAAEQSGVVPKQTPQLAVHEQLLFSAVLFGCFFVYNAVQHRLWGRTLGKRALGLRVVCTDGTRLSWGQAVVRGAVSDLVVLVPTAGPLFKAVDSLWPLRDKPHRQAIHDKAAGTVVVKR